MGLQATAIRDMLYTAATYGEAYDNLRKAAGFTQDDENAQSAGLVNLVVEGRRRVCGWFLRGGTHCIWRSRR